MTGLENYENNLEVHNKLNSTKILGTKNYLNV